MSQMTLAEFESQKDSILSEIHPSFRSYITWTAWDREHSMGYQAVLNEMRVMVNDIKPCLDKFISCGDGLACSQQSSE